MRTSKSDRIFLGAVTFALALAGTGLTIANNVANDFQLIAIALTLAASFTAAEITFLWGHKRYETVQRLWRKIVLSVALGILVLSMGYAVYEELQLALHKVSNRSLASNTTQVVQAADKKNQRFAIKESISTLTANKIDVNAVPFVICYIISGLVSLVIVAVGKQLSARINIKGNVIPDNPKLQETLKIKGFAPDVVKAYEQKNGFALWQGSKYLGFVTKDELKQ